MAKEKTVDECPLDHKCAMEMIHSMKKAQGDIETLAEQMEDMTKKLDDIHKVFVMLGGFKRGMIATLVTCSIIYLFYTGKISLKELINLLL